MMKKSVVLMLFMAVATIKAATFTVNNTNDMGAGSLRQAILDANASPGADIIDITVSGTLNLATPLPVITEQVTIDGSGQSFTINGNNNTGVGLEFDSGAANSQVLNINIDNIGFVSDQGRSATGIISDAAGMLIDGVTITNVVGEDGPSMSGVSLPGGDAIGIDINANNVTVQNSTIDTISGGNGSSPDNTIDPSNGGLAHGISIGAVTGTVITGNTITQITGGDGGNARLTALVTRNGADGGQAFGVFIASGGSDNLVTLNAINTSTGGQGGGISTANVGGAGGDGGLAGNIRVEGDNNQIIQNSNLGSNTGGQSESGGNRSPGSGGPSGIPGDAVSIDIVGSNNLVQSNDLSPGGNIGGTSSPTAASSGDVDGTDGAAGGDAFSIRVIGDDNMILENINIGANTGGEGQTGGGTSGAGFVAGTGGAGGNAYGIGILGSGNLVQNNSLPNDNNAGSGGFGGLGSGESDAGTGGDGGNAAHMLITGSENDIRENELSGSNTGGDGVSGRSSSTSGAGGDGGNGGNGLHMFITGSGNNIGENTLNATHTAGSGGPGGPGGEGFPDGQPGDDGATFGILVDTGNEDSILTNSIFGSASQPGILLQSAGNDEQVAPTITSFASCEGLVSVTGELNNNDALLGNRQYIIEFFSNGTSSDPEQGQTFIGQITVTTDASGNVTFMDQFLAVAPVSNDFITATATLNSGTPINNTSQFSVPLQATVGQPVDNVSVITMLGEPVTITLSGMASTPMMFEILQQPTNGTLSTITPLTGPPNITAEVIYTPNAGFVGIDSFTYSFEDDVCFGTVTIEVLSGDPNRDLTPIIADKYGPFCNLLPS